MEKYNEIQLTKNKMDSNIRKMTNYKSSTFPENAKISFVQYKGDSIENFILTARASAQLLLPSHNNSSRKEDVRTRNEVPF